MKIVITFTPRLDKSIPDFGEFDYIDLIKQAFDSAKRFGYETVFITTENLKDKIECDHQLIVDNQPFLMNWILSAQKAFIDSSLFDCDSVIFSPDAIIRKELIPVFEQEFDIAVTVRKTNDSPINNGVIFLKPKHKENLSKLWYEFIWRCDQYSINKKMWYGDQLSMVETFKHYGKNPFSLKVLQLPCEIYNASILTNGLDIKESDQLMIDKAFILHFKGARKEVMKDFTVDDKKEQMRARMAKAREARKRGNQ